MIEFSKTAPRPRNVETAACSNAVSHTIPGYWSMRLCHQWPGEGQDETQAREAPQAAASKLRIQQKASGALCIVRNPTDSKQCFGQFN
jgi:hypothetical protein